MNSDLILVGGGIISLATAYAIWQKYPDLSVIILEKESELALHQTGRNSGVIHSGLYYKPGSLKAKFCASGREKLIRFAEENGIPYDLCGKIIVATEEEELPRLKALYDRAMENGLTEVRAIDPEAILAIEPEVQGIAGLWVPYAGIINYKTVTEKLASLISQSESYQIQKDCEVLQIEEKKDYVNLRTNQGNFTAKMLIVCAGLQGDLFCSTNQLKSKVQIVPFRGDYYELTAEAQNKVRNLVYPVPDPQFPFLGVHFTRMIYGGVECGPNAVFSFKREGYHRFSFSLKDSLKSLTFSGTWRLFARHWREGLLEYRRALSKKQFLKSLQRLVPNLKKSELLPGRSGIRAQALDEQGNLLDDFVIQNGERSIQVLNAPSPAATSSLAIGEYIAEEAQRLLKL